ncbi:Coiled-coil domain-containing protein 142 [Zootermopsis nevadensis]|uniref:Coiled-coil domain-containing protein 142 n=2 Tax=Zootermopsis nevadensis TaxID=136037 RepID=A0A067QIY6_ZOONE|nr:Coiled-coil domain-containing protein 142 [Zootermopsis nevadensis]
MATVCRTISLANLHMCFPKPHYWRRSSSTPPKPASPYVQEYLDRVLCPVLTALLPLPIPVQQSIGALVLKLLCEAWLDHIYLHRTKFSEWGALQLLVDFDSVPDWLEGCAWLPTEVRNHLVHCEVLRRCEGVGRLLLRRPGEPIAMVAPVSANKNNTGDRDSPKGSLHSRGLDTMPAEMFVPNQEQWLELRVPKHKGLCGPYSLCCSS